MTNKKIDIQPVDVLSKSTYVFSIIKPSRYKWHRHLTLRCRSCRTFIVYFCDAIPELRCTQGYHASNEQWSYVKADQQIPKDILECKQKIMEKFDYDCKTHIQLLK